MTCGGNTHESLASSRASMEALGVDLIVARGQLIRAREQRDYFLKPLLGFLGASTVGLGASPL
jgi:hypothetical protein